MRSRMPSRIVPAGKTRGAQARRLADFLQNTTLRKAIHARERGHPSIKRPRQLRQEEISSASFGWPCRVSDQRTDP